WRVGHVRWDVDEVALVHHCTVLQLVAPEHLDLAIQEVDRRLLAGVALRLRAPAGRYYRPMQAQPGRANALGRYPGEIGRSLPSSVLLNRLNHADGGRGTFSHCYSSGQMGTQSPSPRRAWSGTIPSRPRYGRRP